MLTAGHRHHTDVGRFKTFTEGEMWVSGKRNIATMVDEKGLMLRYTMRQRSFGSRLTRYREVLTREREIEAEETRLSMCSHRTNDEKEFLAFLHAKRDCDEKTGPFYTAKKWRNWKFRIFCRRKKSEDLFLERVSGVYGPDCMEIG